ncbi:MAG: hypothetical protein A2V77_05455 [Anaeromyxobacter sp. RBG_16_69_14]|nr:MAG: hypothetical protein A2V77_05455 [Anaeromyxobacter sp. RBG_16_69_14]
MSRCPELGGASITSSMADGDQETAFVMEKPSRSRSLLKIGSPMTTAKYPGVFSMRELEVDWPRACDASRDQTNPLARRKIAPEDQHEDGEEEEGEEPSERGDDPADRGEERGHRAGHRAGQAPGSESGPDFRAGIRVRERSRTHSVRPLGKGSGSPGPADVHLAPALDGHDACTPSLAATTL